MADWDGRKSPLGCHWAVPLNPGSDTDFHAVRPGVGCFSLGKRMLFIRELTRLLAESGVSFEALKEIRKDTVVCLDGMNFGILKEFEHLAAASSIFEIAGIVKRIAISCSLDEKLALNPLRKIYLSTFGIPVDRVNFSSYTKGKDEITQMKDVVNLKSGLNEKSGILSEDELLFEAGYGRTIFGLGGYGL